MINTTNGNVSHVVIRDDNGKEINILFVKNGMSSIKSFSELPESIRNLPDDALIIINPRMRGNQIVLNNHSTLGTMRNFRFNYDDSMIGVPLPFAGAIIVFSLLFVCMIVFVLKNKKNRLT